MPRNMALFVWWLSVTIRIMKNPTSYTVEHTKIQVTEPVMLPVPGKKIP